MTGRIRIEFHPIALPLEELRLDAVDLKIAAVEASASLLGWHNTREPLVLTFREPIPAKESSWIEVSYSVAEPERGLYFRTPAMGYRVGCLWFWHPEACVRHLEDVRLVVEDEPDGKPAGAKRERCS